MPAELMLASSSPRRRALLATLTIPFTVQPADVDETLLLGETPSSAVLRLATAKAETMAARFPTAIVLAADTLVVSPDQTILGKPANPAAARTMLHTLRGRTHTVITAFAICSGGDQQNRVVTTLVRMRDYRDAEIADYIASGDPLDKAGGYAIQHQGFRPVAAIEGCYTNVVGLPLCTAYVALGELGLEPSVLALAACNAYGNTCPLANSILGGRSLRYQG